MRGRTSSMATRRASHASAADLLRFARAAGKVASAEDGADGRLAAPATSVASPKS